ncbi:T9SS type A sorting domain-containing protein [Crocinitomix catalasitica]|nr:T9SS type A sorting domain-containing protein [Crocinitomix catalasitica]
MKNRLFRYFALVAACLCWHFSLAQNLVPNPSFEDFISCPDSEDQIQYATGWYKCSPSSTTPDYYNACAGAGPFTCPDAPQGYQVPFNGGNAFAGIGLIVTTIPEYREHIGIQLDTPLDIGVKYFLSFYAVIPETFYQNLPSNNLGLKLSTVAYDEFSPVSIDNQAHIFSSEIMEDSVNWVRISGSIIADQAYQYLMIGNFFDDATTDTLHWPTPYTSFGSYYYVDEVCVSTDSLLCNTAVSIQSSAIPDVRISPNPANDFIRLTFDSHQVTNICVSNMMGEIVFETKFSDKEIEINCIDWPEGIYFIRTEWFSKKIFINH